MTRIAFTAALCLSFFAACGDDALPRVNQEIRVQTDNFLPQAAFIPKGGDVRWYNFLRKASGNLRTVTSGIGPEDPDAGERFDVELEGWEGGETRGESFTFTFSDAETVHYFSRFPVGDEFRGMIVVQ